MRQPNDRSGGDPRRAELTDTRQIDVLGRSPMRSGAHTTRPAGSPGTLGPSSAGERASRDREPTPGHVASPRCRSQGARDGEQRHVGPPRLTRQICLMVCSALCAVCPTSGVGPVGRPQVLRPRPRRERDQHRQPPRRIGVVSGVRCARPLARRGSPAGAPRPRPVVVVGEHVVRGPGGWRRRRSRPRSDGSTVPIGFMPVRIRPGMTTLTPTGAPMRLELGAQHVGQPEHAVLGHRVRPELGAAGAPPPSTPC